MTEQEEKDIWWNQLEKKGSGYFILSRCHCGSVCPVSWKSSEAEGVAWVVEHFPHRKTMSEELPTPSFNCCLAFAERFPDGERPKELKGHHRNCPLVKTEDVREEIEQHQRIEKLKARFTPEMRENMQNDYVGKVLQRELLNSQIQLLEMAFAELDKV